MTADWSKCECLCRVNHPYEGFPCQHWAEVDGLCWACREWWQRDSDQENTK